MEFLNYVVIRFSLKLKAEWEKKAYGDEGVRDAWFAMRAKIFKDYTYPSLANQSSPAHKILIFMDGSDVDNWGKHLALPAPFIPIFTEGNNLNDETRRIIGEGPKDGVVISRVDSDDAVSRHYLKCLNKSAALALDRGDEKKYIVAANGFITDGARIQSIYYNCSPFISLFVKRYSGEVIYDFAHEKVLERNPFIDKNAIWMQVFHGTNVANRFRLKSRFVSGDKREMVPGPLLPVDSAWPSGFPPFVEQ